MAGTRSAGQGRVRQLSLFWPALADGCAVAGCGCSGLRSLRLRACSLLLLVSSAGALPLCSLCSACPPPLKALCFRVVQQSPNTAGSTARSFPFPYIPSVVSSVQRLERIIHSTH